MEQIPREELLKMEKEEAIDILLSVIGEMAKIIQKQGEEIAELKRRLNQTSQNSSKAPSSDIYEKPKSLRKSSGKKAGGQAGHEGSGLKIMQEPDEVKKHMPEECEGCEHREKCLSLSRESETRYEIDIEIRPIVTAHRSMEVECPKRRETIRGEFPLGITGTVQYGVNLESLAVSLTTSGMVSINRRHEILSGVFGLPISTGTIASMIKRCAGAVKETVRTIKEAIMDEPVVHFDETGVRVEEKNHWAHVAGTESHTYISVESKRGEAGMTSAGILPGYTGIGIHDCWSPYFKYDGMRHGLCCAHLLRELTAVTENHNQEWAQKMSDLLIEMKDEKEKLIALGEQQVPAHLWDKYSNDYDKIVIEAQAANPIPEKDPDKKGRPKRGKTRSLVDRLDERKHQWLLFFTDFNVPFTNNQAERDLRMFKVKQKVAGCFRTKDGADNFAAIMSFIGTARKNGLSAFHAIKNALIGSPFALPFHLNKSNN